MDPNKVCPNKLKLPSSNPVLRITVILVLTGLFLSFTIPTVAQKNIHIDTVLIKPHSVTKATLMSTALPGLGQAYNKIYWKIPIIYIGFGAFTYFIIKNSQQYKKYREAYNWAAAGDSSIVINNDYIYKYTESQLLDGKNYYRRNLEFTYILTGIWYLLNILDASVDAHFFDYDISDDLTIRIDPMIESRKLNIGTVTGLTVTLKF